MFALWAAEEIDIDDDVDLSLAIGNYGQNGIYDDTAQFDDPSQQHHIAAFSQIPDVVKRFIVHFHQAVLDNNLPEITVAYESGWNRLTEKYYSKSEWPEAETIAPLVNDDQIFLILYRELYYRHVYSRLQPNIDDRFHSYENSCELFNYLLSTSPSSFSIPYLTQTLVRLGRPCPSRPPRTMALGHYRRIYLPISILLRLALKTKNQIRR